jgi:hypothetical protein
MPTLVTQLGGVSFSASGLPPLKSLVKGFVSLGLVTLYRFNDASVTSILNEAPGGISTAVQAMGSANDLAAIVAGGGIRLKGTSFVPDAVAMDVSQPFTYMVHTTLAVPAPTANQGIMSTVGYPNRGFIWFAQSGSNPATETFLTNVFRQSKNGVQGGTFQIPGSAQYVYTNARTLALTWDGTTFRASVWNAGTLVKDKLALVPLVDITTNASGQVSNLITLATGSTSLTYPGIDMMVDAVAVYNRVLTDSEIIANDANCIALRTTRGR